MIVVGIDPGLHGAVAVLSFVQPGLPPYILDIFDMPTIAITKGAKNSTAVDWPEYVNILEGVRLFGPKLLVFEKVGAMMKQGVKQGTVSAFTFGATAGGQQQLARYILGCRMELAVPVVWKRTMKVGTADGDILTRTQYYFPGEDARWKTPRGRLLDGRCEAALLAAYGQYLMEAKR
jgi:hypothetical protein